MTNLLISHLTPDHVGQTVTLNGRVQTIRSSGKVAFVELRDGSGYIQCVAEPQFVAQFDTFTSL
jgi:aspartyl-tRNA synthetase